MSDLNEWRLEYGNTVLDFGTLASEYPLASQVEIGDADLTTQDSDHPTSDGTIFGRDRLGGFTLTFSMTTVPEFSFPMPDRPWATALDLLSTFKSKWRANSVRREAGAYATLTNLDRNRMVYGRPRKIAQTTKTLRKGILGMVATFDTNSPDFYDATEKLAIITPVPTPLGGFTTPLRPPFSTAGSTQELAPMANAGDLDAWPIVKFHGPGSNYSLELLDNNRTIWNLRAPARLAFDEVLEIDTRPWARGATINGRPANGRLRGTQLERCTIPVGDFNARFKVTDARGQAFADIRWHDTYASL